MSEIVLNAVAGWVFTKAGELLLGAGGNFTHEGVKRLWSQAGAQLAEGRVPINHDIGRAANKSLVGAVHLMVKSIRRSTDSTVTSSSTGTSIWDAATSTLTNRMGLHKRPATSDDRWLDALISVANQPDAFKQLPDWHDPSTIAQAAHSAIDVVLQDGLHRSFLRWCDTAIASELTRPAAIERCILEGWTLSDTTGERITLYGAFCLFFLEEVKGSESVFRACLVQTLGMISKELQDRKVCDSTDAVERERIIDELRRLQHTHHAEMVRIVDARLYGLLSALIPAVESLRARQDAQRDLILLTYRELADVHRDLENHRLASLAASERIYSQLSSITHPQLPHGANVAALLLAAAQPQRPIEQFSRSAGLKDRDRLRQLADRVKLDWVEGVLDCALHRLLWVQIELEWRRDIVANPWDTVLIRRDKMPTTLRSDQSVGEIFHDSRQSLLIVGQPGCGKTTVLLSLAKELLASIDENGPVAVPVVLPLSFWHKAEADCGSWIVEQLHRRYQVPKSIARRWMTSHRLVLLLDGLDEVRPELRRSCVSAINAFIGSDVGIAMAVTCRADECAQLDEKLSLGFAVCIAPLTRDQVDDYLGRAGPRLAGLRRALHDDVILCELATTPLFLSVLSVAFIDGGADRFPTTLMTRQELHASIFDVFVDRLMHRPGKQRDRQTIETTLRDLATIANGMSRHGESVFLIRDIQPTWCMRRTDKVVYLWITRVAIVIACNLCVYTASRMMQAIGTGRPISILLWPLAALAVGTWIALIDIIVLECNVVANRARLARSIAPAVPLAAAFIMARWLPSNTLPVAGVLAITAATAMIAFAASGTPLETDIGSSAQLGWSGRRSLHVTVVWLYSFGWFYVIVEKGGGLLVYHPTFTAIAVLLGVCAGLAAIAPRVWRRQKPQWQEWLKCFTWALTVMCLVHMVRLEIEYRASSHFIFISPMFLLYGWCTLVLAFVSFWGGLSTTLGRRHDVEAGRWVWLRDPLRAAAIAVGPVLLALAAMALYSETQDREEDLFWMERAVIGISGLGLLVAIRFGLLNGVKYWVLRRILAQSGVIPANVQSSLAHAGDIGLVQRVGGGFRFVHRLLQEHIAARRNRTP